MAWVSHAEVFPLKGNEEHSFATLLDILEEALLIAILDREGTDDKESLEEREAIEDPMLLLLLLLLEARELLDCPAFVGAIAFIVR